MAKGKKGGGKKPAHKAQRYGAYGSYKGVNVRKARRLVNRQIKQQIEGPRDDARQLKRDYIAGQRGINKIYGATRKNISDANSKIASGYSQAQAKNNAAQQALMQQLQDNQSDQYNKANSELMRLGISDGSSLSAINSSAQNAMNVASQTGANNSANTNAMAAGARSVGQLMLGGAAASRATALNENRNDYRDAMSEVRDAIADARGTRSDLLLQLLEQMRQSGWQQHVDQANINLQRDQFNFQKRQAAKASAGGGSGGGGSSGGGGGSSSGGSSGSSGSDYTPVIGLMNNAIGGGGKKPKHKKKKPKSQTGPFYGPTGPKLPHLGGEYF